MEHESRHSAKRLFVAFSAILFFGLLSSSAHADGMVIDHTCADIEKVPAYWIEMAKRMTLHYGHTSHGSQIISGILALYDLNPAYAVAVRESDSEGLPPAQRPPALRIYDGNPPETYIEPDDYWESEEGRVRTRSVADTGKYDFSMWSWCGQVSWYGDEQIQDYLNRMDQFESRYSAMRFIYMTGHLDGTGSGGDLYRNNEAIREDCRANGKVLFDFADIERYDPDGTDYLDRGGDDECDYFVRGIRHNWADEWCAENPGSDLCIWEDAYGDCAHSKPLNCHLKARTFWWMMARLAGWQESSCASVDIQTVSVHIPCLDLGTSARYWLDMRLSKGAFVFWDAGVTEGSTGTFASFDAGTGILHIPCLDFGVKRTYWLDLRLTKNGFTISDFGMNP